jgi:hypothetical protein
MIGDELMARIARVRAELAECEKLVREIGGKAHARQLADLIERAGEVERVTMKEEMKE